jgi:hypothetical protein
MGHGWDEMNRQKDYIKGVDDLQCAGSSVMAMGGMSVVEEEEEERECVYNVALTAFAHTAFR